jgi:uncharacterized protein (DUF302 family)
MKTIILFLFFAYLSSTVIWSQTPTKSESNQSSKSFFLENESKFNFDETVEKLKAEAEKKTWKIIATHDLQESLKKNGKEVLPVKVLALCHPKHSGKILEKDNERIISSMMPCRVSIYQKSNGKTYISRMNSAAMAINFEGVIRQVMTESTAEIEEIIKGLIK